MSAGVNISVADDVIRCAGLLGVVQYAHAVSLRLTACGVVLGGEWGVWNCCSGGTEFKALEREQQLNI